MLRLAQLLMLLAIGPAAAQPAPAATRDVVGVAANDVLNVRNAPSASAPLVGALSPLASGVVMLGIAEGWTQVSHDNLKGWVASRYLARSEAQAPPSTGAWECGGTEPFWSATLKGRDVAFSTPDEGQRNSQLTGLTTSANSQRVWSFRFEDGAAQALVASDTICSDGMSDTVYRRTIHVLRAGKLLSGCCRRP